MATLIALGGALDTSNLGITQFLSATSYSNSATQVVASFGGGRTQILTGNFIFDGSGALIGGTITGIAESNLAGSSYQMTGLSLPVMSFLGFLNAGDTTGLTAALFAGNDGVLGGNSKNDTLSGGTGADTLSGLGGDDILDGGAGADQMIGEAGNDTYFVDNIGDQVIESGVGNDTIIASTNYGLGLNIENLTLVGTATIAQGNELANVLTGNALANTLLGMQGNDTLLGNDGNDAMAGGTEHDLLIGGNGNDTLDGEAGNDTLDGGSGNDKMTGADGDDTYTVDGINDAVIELSGKGTDTVIASISHGLAINIENLILTGDAKIGNGNQLDNTVTGNNLDNFLNASDGNDTVVGAEGKDTLLGAQGNDLLLGGDGDDDLVGGPGNDTMEGGKGNDTYALDDLGDVIIETPDSGIDTVVASIDYQLASNIENLTLRGGAHTGVGNDLDNVLTGNIVNKLGNQLDGGAGNDTLVGNDGNDTLTGAEGDDSLLGGGGDDYLGGDLTTGSGNDTLDGGAGADSIDGGHGNDRLYGDFGAPEGAGNDTLDGGTGADTMNGGLGDDLYLVDGQEDVVAEFEADGGIDTVHSTGASFTLGSGIENLTLKDGALSGSGNELDNVITGNDSRNFLNGGNGNDTILAGAGDDFLKGNAGNDFLDGGDHNDNIEGGEGADSISGGAGNDWMLAGDGDDTLAGGIGSDTLGGMAGNDILDGGAGVDHLEGGDGDDVYHVNDTADIVLEFANQGTDTVLSTVSFSISSKAHIENLTLLGSDNTFAVGNGAANLIIGNAGDNLLDGAGGNDTMAGAAGDDVYLVEGGDVIIENADEGMDMVWAFNDFELAANIEILVAIGAGSKGVGNALDNEMYAGENTAALYGLEGADTLIGGSNSDTLIGGAGEDRMEGGSGSDVYGVDSKFDQIIELGGDAEDRVESSIDFELGENLENLVLLSGAMVGKGNSSDNQLQGNGGNNALFGNDGNDAIDGGAGNDTLLAGDGSDFLIGGAGADSMAGGAGDDFYGVDSKLDHVSELSGGGHDTVESSVDYTLGVNMEDLVLIDAAYRGSGNNLANTITGNDAVNILDGGSGNDTIHGGGGNDILYGSFGNDLLYGGAGNDRIDCFYNQDRAIYSSVLDGHDLLTNFSTGGTGQDYVDLDGLFDSLGVAAADRAGRVSIVDNGGGADVCIDTDGVGGWDLNLASIQYVPDLSAITVGTATTDDVFVGT